MKSFVGCAICLALGLGAAWREVGAQDSNQAPIKSLILPGTTFLVQDRPAFILQPPEKDRRRPQPWILYAPTLPAYPDHHEKWMHEQFLAAGIAVAGIDVGEAYGSPHGCDLLSAFYEELTTNSLLKKANKWGLLARFSSGSTQLAHA